jgi:hypothetical protein
MNQTGALLDMTKLQFVSKEWLARLPKDVFVEKALEWAESYSSKFQDERYKDINLLDLMKKYPEYTFNALNIERLTDQDPKRYRVFSDIIIQLPAFYDEVYTQLSATKPALPEACAKENMNAFLDEYETLLDLDMTKEEWFAQFKEIGKKYGFAASNGDFKA